MEKNIASALQISDKHFAISHEGAFCPPMKWRSNLEEIDTRASYC